MCSVKCPTYGHVHVHVLALCQEPYPNASPMTSIVMPATASLIAVPVLAACGQSDLQGELLPG